MKIRLLKKILKTDRYIVANFGDYIGIGSSLCHDLIKLDLSSMNITYALDTYREGRKALDGKEPLGEIWDSLQALIDSGEIADYLEGSEEIPNPVKCYSVEKGQVIEHYTEECTCPNITHKGELIYENTHFLTREKAIEKALGEYGVAVEMAIEQKAEKQREIYRIEDRIKKYTAYSQMLTK